MQVEHTTKLGYPLGAGMNILVCIKQVLDPDMHLEIDSESRWVAETDSSVYRLNRFDEYGLEEAVLIKEAFPGVCVDAISVGPERVGRALRASLALGADNAIHIHHDETGYCPPQAIAALIAAYARHHSYDLILTGVMSEDLMQSLVGPMIAENLNIPCAASVTKEEIDFENSKVTVECELHDQIAEKVVLKLPALLTIQSGINNPRYPSLSNKLRSIKQELITVEASRLVPSISQGPDYLLSYPEKTGAGMMLEGTAEQKAEKLIEILFEKSLLK